MSQIVPFLFRVAGNKNPRGCYGAPAVDQQMTSPTLATLARSSYRLRLWINFPNAGTVAKKPEVSKVRASDNNMSWVYECLPQE